MFIFDFSSVTNDLVEMCREKSKQSWKRGELRRFTYWIERGARYAAVQLEYEKESGKGESTKTF
ncbi:hypothetical protein GGR02_001852 [Anoxybacillus voinovskiensis]|uniref:Uncharacterized protein n=1 Tax=Anoxybacteroides voinovskiense TaxID=230470 RepID=A0A840DUR5_9BACL|nr:hypothetical protein [Anoxybacillus voinovskiensis]GGJ68491.1 hypothetical protein GCM10008982_17380 [Anoxybacillus voinovskiensis]